MIDVHLQPFGRSLMTMALGALKYQAVVKQKNIDNFKKEIKNIKSLEKKEEMFTDISFDITSKMIDRRFTISKDFIASGGTTKTFQFKKATSESDKHLQYVTQKNMLQSRTKLNAAVSKHNQRLTDMKIKTSFKLINLKPIFK